MSAYRLRILGSFELHDGAGTPIRLPTRKAEALLAYLALASGRAPARDTLTALLWGDASEQNARASLRQTLSLLGKALGNNAIEAQGRSISLAEGALEIDAVELDRCSTGAAPEAMQRAAELYRGDLLAGLAINEIAFEDWLLPERERLRDRAIDVLARLVALHNERGESEQAIQAALRLLAIDPLEEITHRTLMRLYADQGRRAAALRQYQVCVDVLQREFGAAPDAETRSLYNELLRHRDTGAVSPSAEMPAHATPLIGRDEELADAVGLLDGVRAGRGRVVAILGQAGIGKTRLTQELATRATAAGMRILQGRCFESQQLFPFAPWLEMFRAAGVPEDRALLQELGAPWRAELARLLPELAASQQDAGDKADADVQSRGLLFEAIARLVALLAARAPLLLIVEDFHWADEMSLRLLAALGRRMQVLPVMIVVTAREEELPGALALRRAMQELEQDGLLVKVALMPLSHEETEILVRAMVRTGEDECALERLAERVWQTSEGNPFVVVECMRASGRETERGSAAALSLPERVRDLIKGHVERQSQAAQELVAVAAVAGREFDFALLQRAAGMDEREASEALEELVRRRILHAVGDNFDFVHDRIRRMVDESLLAPARRILHAAIAQALEANRAADLERVYDRLAYHYSRTDYSDKAVTYLTRFAERAARAGAHNQAITALDEALDHVQRAPYATRERRRFDLVFRKTRSLLLLGRLREVVDLLLPEQALVDAAGDPQMAGAYCFRLGAACIYLGDYANAEKHAARALDEASACADVATMGKAHFLLAFRNFWGHPEKGVRHGEQAVALLEGTREEWWLGQSCWILGLNLSYRGRFAEGLAMEARASMLGEALDDRRLGSSAAWATGFISTLAGDWETALSACRKGVALSPDPLTRMTTVGMLALAHVERREPDAAILLLDEVIPLTEKFRFAQLHGLYLGFRGEAALQAGDPAAALKFALQGSEITRRAGYAYGLGWTQRILGRIAHASGHPAQAGIHLEEAIATFRDMGAPFETGRTHLELGELLEASADKGGARTHAEAALEILQALAPEAFIDRARKLKSRLAAPASTPAGY